MKAVWLPHEGRGERRNADEDILMEAPSSKLLLRGGNGTGGWGGRGAMDDETRLGPRLNVFPDRAGSSPARRPTGTPAGTPLFPQPADRRR